MIIMPHRASFVPSGFLLDDFQHLTDHDLRKGLKKLALRIIVQALEDYCKEFVAHEPVSEEDRRSAEAFLRGDTGMLQAVAPLAGVNASEIVNVMQFADRRTLKALLLRTQANMASRRSRKRKSRQHQDDDEDLEQ